MNGTDNSGATCVSKASFSKTGAKLDQKKVMGERSPGSASTLWGSKGGGGLKYRTKCLEYWQVYTQNLYTTYVGGLGQVPGKKCINFLPVH